MGIQLQTLEHNELSSSSIWVARFHPITLTTVQVFVDIGYHQQHASLSLDGASRFSGDGTDSPLYLR